MSTLNQPPSFSTQAPSVMGEWGGRGRGRRSIDDAGSGSDCLLAILINYRGNPWRNDDVPRAQVSREEKDGKGAFSDQFSSFQCAS